MKVEQGEEYSFDDDTQTTTQSNSNSGRIPIEPQNFFAVAERVMTQTQNKVAFIIDWSNYLFGQVNALSETERAWLQQISTSLRDSEQSNSPQSMVQAQSVLIFLCAGTSILPPSVYLNNPFFAEINIALPSIQEREHAILARQVQWNISDNLSVGSQALANLVTLTDGLSLRDIDNLVRLSLRVIISPLSLNQSSHRVSITIGNISILFISARMSSLFALNSCFVCFITVSVVACSFMYCKA